jgi:hypothetical protein
VDEKDVLRLFLPPASLQHLSKMLLPARLTQNPKHQHAVMPAATGRTQNTDDPQHANRSDVTAPWFN